jgi:hypothetical protein
VRFTDAGRREPDAVHARCDPQQQIGDHGREDASYWEAARP